MTSGRAACTCEWIAKAAWFSGRSPCTIVPSWRTSSRSLTRMCPKCMPNGLTQKWSSSSGSRAVMCPATPSSKPNRLNRRNAAARFCLRCRRSSSMVRSSRGSNAAVFPPASRWACSAWSSAMDVLLARQLRRWFEHTSAAWHDNSIRLNTTGDGSDHIGQLGQVTRVIRFNAFDMNCVAHQSPGLWKHPDDQSWRYKDLTYWTELAKLLERGRFDGLFIADVLGTYDVYGASDEAAIRQAAQIPVGDPLLLVSAMALVTKDLGFGITTGTGFEHPYPFARRISTLDHLTNGRIGWNVVTGYLPAAARNMGQTDQPAHDARYDHADEYLEVLYKLWEGSWEDDAVVRDRARGIFTDPDKVHHIGHVGEHFSVPGVHLVEPSIQRTPVIYQAGSSPRGVRFAAENAEAIFTAAPTKA